MLSNSTNIIMVCYLSGLRGQAVDHVINMSPEMVGKSGKSSSPAGDGSLHDHPGPLGIMPDGQPVRLYWDATPDGMEGILSSARTSDGMPLSEALDRGKISGTSLLPPNTVRRLLPGATTVSLSWGKRWYRAIRDAGSKLWNTSTATDNNIGKYLRWQSGRMSLDGGDWISIHTRMCDDPSIGRKQYMRLESRELVDFQSGAARDADHLCDLHTLFSEEHADREYAALCDACGITPVPDLALPWLRRYQSMQWVR